MQRMSQERATMRYLILLIVVSLLAGCAIDPKQREAHEAAHLRELARVCEKVGYPSGTDQNKDCVIKLLAAEIAQPTIVNYPYSPYPPTLCRTVGSKVICSPY
jgi:uncharacterized lipoprotein YajG